MEFSTLSLYIYFPVLHMRTLKTSSSLSESWTKLAVFVITCRYRRLSHSFRSLVPFHHTAASFLICCVSSFEQSLFLQSILYNRFYLYSNIIFIHPLFHDIFWPSLACTLQSYSNEYFDVSRYLHEFSKLRDN